MATRSTVAIIEYYLRMGPRLDEQVKRLMLEYARAESEVVALILAGLSEKQLTSLKERRRRVALANQILRAIDATSKEKIPPIINKAFQIGTHLADLSTDEETKGLSELNRTAMKLLIENLIEDLGSATQTVGRTVEDIFRKEALRVAISNVPGERPVTVAARDLEKALRDQNITAFIDRTGRRWGLRHYAETAAFSVTQEALNVANANILLERGIDLVQINTVHDPCVEVCLEFNGNIYSLTGRAPGVPVLKVRPPFHPRCRHIMFAAPGAFDEREKSGWRPPGQLVQEEEPVTA